MNVEAPDLDVFRVEHKLMDAWIDCGESGYELLGGDFNVPAVFLLLFWVDSVCTVSLE